VLVVPQAGGDAAGVIPPEQLTLSAELRAAVLAYLDDRRLLGTTLDVQPPQYLRVSVDVTLHLPERRDPAAAPEVIQRAEAALYRYLNPFTGGPTGDGWPFGRDLHLSEIYGLLQRIPAIEFVEEVRITIAEGGGAAQAMPSRLPVPRHAVVCSGQHRVSVS